MKTLLLPARNSPDAQVIWRAAVAAGWRTERLVGWKMPQLDTRDLAFYGESLLAAHVAQSLNVSFIEAPLDWLVHLPYEYVKRCIVFTTVGATTRDRSTRFIKPASDKAFPAKVYSVDEDFSVFDTCDANLATLESEIVQIEAEYRFFVLNRRIQTGSIYCRSGKITEHSNGDWEIDDAGTKEAADFAQVLLDDDRVLFPPATVLDVCITADRGWMVIECNPAWGSGIYGCDPALILPVLARACVPNERLDQEDPRFFLQQKSAN